MSWYEKYLPNQQNFEILSAPEKRSARYFTKKNIVHIIKGLNNSPLISIEKILLTNSQQTETDTILTISSQEIAIEFIEMQLRHSLIFHEIYKKQENAKHFPAF